MLQFSADHCSCAPREKDTPRACPVSLMIQILEYRKEASNEKIQNCLSFLNPPLDLEARDRGLSSKTLCMESEQILPDGSRVRHYDVHKLYGWAQTRPTYE